LDRENKETRKIGRREFISTSVSGTVGACMLARELSAGQSKFLPFPTSKLDTRPFGNTGANVSLLTLGGGGPWVNSGEDIALRILTEALDRGVNCIDTAYSYGNGKSEEYIGALMPRRRKDVLIHTKVSTRDKNLWWKHFEISLKRLKVDYVDTLMIHALDDSDDLEKLEGKDGPFELLQKAKEQKLARWTGVSAHWNCPVLLEAERRHNFDHVMVSLNVATNGFNDMGFEESALPVLARKGTAITAMKAMGAGRIVQNFPEFDYKTCLGYTLSLPSVPTVTVTMPNIQYVINNCEVVKGFQPFSAEKMAALKEKAQGELKTSFREFMATHSDYA
jgi:uncharacterized protein